VSRTCEDAATALAGCYCLVYVLLLAAAILLVLITHPEVPIFP
jgi:hypothetical protein